MNYDELYDALNLMLGDTNNFALTTEQKQLCLTQAFKDQYVVEQVSDATLVFSNSSNEYPIPVGITTITDISYANSSSDFPDSVDNTLWDTAEGNLTFSNRARSYLSDGYGFTVKGWKKLTILDTVNDEAVQNYILALAAYNCLRNIGYTKIMKFVRNDTTVSEIIGMRREFERDVQNYRKQLQQAYQQN